MCPTRRKNRDKLSVREIALNLLSRREHTAEELRLKLVKRGASDSEAEDTIKRLVALGFVDDERACDVFLNAELRARPQGRNRIRMKLASRQVPSSIVTRRLAELDDRWEERQALKAAQIWLRKRKKGAGNREALIRHLSARGFGWSAIRYADESLKIGTESEFMEETAHDD